ncbi:MAG: c-type cytochrome [Magnetococcales bacterium]|nr:c-type cytochrome [Magnetococcales bacterium]
MHKSLFIAIPLVSILIVAYGAWKIFGVDVDAGKRLAENNCGVCHDLTESQQNVKGPYLWGILGRQAGSIDEFAYGVRFREVVEASPFRWDSRSLELFIADPDRFLEGTRMAQPKSEHTLAFSGIQDTTNRRNLLAYLKTLK